jgi:hypothetical protein
MWVRPRDSVLLRQRLTDAGLREDRDERTAVRPALDSRQEMLGSVLYGNPTPGHARC